MNVSNQLITTTGEDGVTIYLSFDETMYSESNSSKLFKSIIRKDYSDESKKDDSNGNSTLEPHNNTTPIKDDHELSAALKPLRCRSSFNFNKLEGQSSTPSKTQDKKHHIEDIEDSHQNSRFSIVFENLASKSEHSMNIVKEDKENQPQNLSETSTRSKTQEKKYHIEDIEDSHRNSKFSIVFENLASKSEDSMNNVKEDKENQPQNPSETNLPSFSKSSLVILQESKKQTTTVSKYLNSNNVAEKKNSKRALDKKAKMHTVVRKSVCEPDLLTNKPSRILASKRFSSVNNDGIINVGIDAWPGYRPSKYGLSDVNKLGCIIENPIITTETETPRDQISNPIKPSRMSIKSSKAANIARRSILPSVPSEICYAPPRFATVVKTTLNSTTRKAPIGLSNDTTSKRRSLMLLQKKLSSPLPIQRKRFSSSNTISSSDDRKSSARSYGGGVDGVVQPSRSRPMNPRRTMYSEESENKFICSECGASYKTKALLDGHKRFHRVTSPDLQNARSHANTATSGNHNSSVANYTCKYCDKGFAIERAIHIHLLEHCPKIPASVRRKLNFKEMDHVNKAETPHFRVQRKITPPRTESTKDPLMNFPVKKCLAPKTQKNGSELDMPEKKMDTNEIVQQEQHTSSSTHIMSTRMAPPTTTKIKKKSAYTGVYRTPNKDIRCLPCKQAYKNIIDYTNHMMSAHKSLNWSNNSIDSQIG